VNSEPNTGAALNPGRLLSDPPTTRQQRRAAARRGTGWELSEGRDYDWLRKPRRNDDPAWRNRELTR
jgi:hypothetical protein